MPIGFMPFHTEKGVVFIGPNGFKNGAKKYLILDFWGPGGKTAITGWYYHLTPDTGQYYHSVWVAPPSNRARRPSSSGTIA